MQIVRAGGRAVGTPRVTPCRSPRCVSSVPAQPLGGGDTLEGDHVRRGSPWDALRLDNCPDTLIRRRHPVPQLGADLIERHRVLLEIL